MDKVFYDASGNEMSEPQEWFIMPWGHAENILRRQNGGQLPPMTVLGTVGQFIQGSGWMTDPIITEDFSAVIEAGRPAYDAEILRKYRGSRG
jgi:hypothetical protein